MFPRELEGIGINLRQLPREGKPDTGDAGGGGNGYLQPVVVEGGNAKLSRAFTEPGFYAEAARRGGHLSAVREPAEVEQGQFHPHALHETVRVPRGIAKAGIPMGEIPDLRIREVVCPW